MSDDQQTPASAAPRPITPGWAKGTGLKADGPLGPLLGLPRWCCWRWVAVPRKAGGVNWTKRPVRPVLKGISGMISTNHAERQGRSYTIAEGAVLRGDADGVGWLLQDETETVWLDLDKCRDAETGQTAAWAEALIDRVPGAYVELTPSGTGLRIAGRAGLDLPMQGNLRMRRFLSGLSEDELARWGGSREAHDRAQVEIFYAVARYVTVTGRGSGRVDGADLGGLAMELWQLAQAQEPERRMGTGTSRGARPSASVGKTAPVEDVVAALDAITNGDGWDEGASWDEWSRIGMACWAATEGSPEGYEAWQAWSSRCEDKHDPATCAERWEHWRRSPPRDLGIGALVIAAGQATGGRFRRPSRAPGVEFQGDKTEEQDDGGGAGETAAGTAPRSKGGRADRPGAVGADLGGGAGGADADGLTSPFWQLADRVTYVKQMYRFMDREDDMAMDEARLSGLAGKMKVKGAASRGQKGLIARLMAHAVDSDEAVRATNEGRPRGGMLVVHSMTLRPGGPKIVTERGENGERRLLLNLWRPSLLVPSDADASPWFEHMARLIPDDASRERVVDRFAFLLQNLGVKVNSALVLLGGQGTGKDTALVPIWEALGQHNLAVVPGTLFGGEFNEYLQRPMVLVSEMPSYRKKSSYEVIKSLLTTPPDLLRINLKGLPAFHVPNIVNLIVTTNNPDAIALTRDDRRFDVVETVHAAGSEGQPYFDRLYRWLAAGGSEAVAGALLRRDIGEGRDGAPAFNPKGSPPVSAAKNAMMAEADPPGMAWGRTLWAKDGPLEKRKLITLHELMGFADRGFWAAGENVRGRHLMRQLEDGLRLDGWANTGVQISEGDARPRPWAKEGVVELYKQMSPATLREHLHEDRKNNAVREF